jgi:hypothetical protein
MERARPELKNILRHGDSASAYKRNDLHDIPLAQRLLGVSGAGNDLAVHLHGNGVAPRLDLVEKLVHRRRVGQVLNLSIDGNAHAPIISCKELD